MTDTPFFERTEHEPASSIPFADSQEGVEEDILSWFPQSQGQPGYNTQARVFQALLDELES